MKKYNKGYTTGVFDIFHIGHLNILKNSKKMCDRLIVGVSTDECVQTYKNKKTVISFCERFEIISSIKYVDEVYPQVNMNKLEACKKYGIDVVFVGDDWKGTPEWIKFEKEFSEIGVDIIYMPYTKGTSSTLLRKALEVINCDSEI